MFVTIPLISILHYCRPQHLYFYASAPTEGALSDDARLTSVCLTFVAYIGSKLRTERRRKTKIGMEVAHVTCDSDTTFKVKRSKVTLQGAGAYCGSLPHSLFTFRFLSDFTYLPQLSPSKLCRTKTHNLVVCASSLPIHFHPV